MNTIEIVDYEPKYQPYFEKFNRDWIEKYFWLEEMDKYVLSNPEEAILKRGGAILMALYDNIPAGTVAIRKVTNDTFEFTKMAVDEAFRRRGIAEALLKAAFDKALAVGAIKVILYSQTQLQPAILLYRKLGFKEVPMEQGLYRRANIKMERMLVAKVCA